jgi:hypothetical protein
MREFNKEETKVHTFRSHIQMSLNSFMLFAWNDALTRQEIKLWSYIIYEYKNSNTPTGALMMELTYADFMVFVRKQINMGYDLYGDALNKSANVTYSKNTFYKARAALETIGLICKRPGKNMRNTYCVNPEHAYIGFAEGKKDAIKWWNNLTIQREEEQKQQLDPVAFHQDKIQYLGNPFPIKNKYDEEQD